MTPTRWSVRMIIKPIDIAQLSESQVSTLLAMSQTPPAAPAAIDELDLLSDSLSEATRTTLLADLQSPVLFAETGPLSFHRLIGVQIDEVQELQGKTFLQALTSARTSREALVKLSTFGSSIMMPALPPSTRLAGGAIRAIARLALHTRFDAELEPHEAERAAAIVQSLASASQAPKRLRDYAQRSARQEPK
jgi:hypothetical protein